MSENNKNLELSNIAARYLHVLDTGDKPAVVMPINNVNEPISKNNLLQTKILNNNKIQDKTFIKSFPNILSDTDVLIRESDLIYKPNTMQMTFLCPPQEELSMSAESFEGSPKSYKLFSPPSKRFCFTRPESSINIPSVDQSSILSDTFFKQDKINTENLFAAKFLENNRSLNLMDTFSNFRNPVIPSVRFELSSSSSSSSDSNVSEEETTFAKAMKSLPNVLENSIDEKKEASTKENKNPSQPIKINTFYEAKDIIDCEKIDEYYKNHTFDWKSVENSIDSLMEPSLDYVAHRYKSLMPIAIGREDEISDYDSSDAMDTIEQSTEEIERSFDRKEFVCSTPDLEFLPNSNGPLNPLDVAFLNMISDAEQSIDDADKTKSFLLEKESMNAWSAITHVSDSVPLTDDPNVEPVFDITTIFDYNRSDECGDNGVDKDKFFDDDCTRYELLMSILNERGNPYEKTSVELHETIQIVQNRKAAILIQIELIIQTLVTSLVNQNSMILKLHKIKDWKDCKFEDNVLSQKETSIAIKTLSFTNKNTERTFTIVVHLLSEIYKLLANSTTCTKRELYYRDVELMKCQNSTNRAIDEICGLLNVQCWELGVLSTSKGLIAGDLIVTTDDDEVIDYSISPNSVPQKPSAIKSMQSTAAYILVVEKDTVFTRLMEDKMMEKIDEKIVLVTAKGYPDVNTRLMLKKMENELRKPIYIIVDADPYGIDIMCTYTFGSLQMVKFAEQLAITKMKWIGIYPTDIEKLDITRIDLTDADTKKVDELIARPYMNDHIKSELLHLKNRGFKAEIESIYHYSIDYLIHDYIPQKIASICSPMDRIIMDAESISEINDIFNKN